MKKNLVIFGTGAIAKIAHYYFSHETKYQVAGFTVDKSFISRKKFLNLPVVDFQRVEKVFSPKKFAMFIAVSYAQMNKLRAEKYFAAKEKGYLLASFISPRATVFDNVQIGDNCFILEDNTVQPFVKIGNNVTLWSGNHIGHDAIIDDHCFISSHVVVSGSVHINQFCFLGVNATLRNGITVEQESLIGAGAVIMADTVVRGVYVPPRSILLDKKSNEIKI